ncbi:MAG: DEAD/DEAH box helicase [Chloroflexi bacterium]|nr:DEAD/DEAH box helicase [Chloroflexota bacterium]
MGQIYVAVDLETTGLNSQKDTIIELGAARFRDGEVLETFSQVVNPGRSIPRNIQQLTGISQAEADAAPALGSVAAQFRRFIGDHPLVGHSIGFDVAFLDSHNLYRFNPQIDTWELALILLPGLPSYKLGRVAEHLGIELVNAHRAFDDAEATMYIFEALHRRAVDLPTETLQQINQIAAGVDWPLALVFAEAEAKAAKQWGQRKRSVPKQSFGPLFDSLMPLEPLQHPQPLDVDHLAAVLEPGGLFDQAFENYEDRPPQVEMLRIVATAFNSEQHIMVEAGTGTGKSIAYLIPALAWATQTGRRVVVSSNTINLQDQLFHKDLPDLQTLLPFEFSATVMKGRSNYLCPRRLRKFLQRADLEAVDVSVLARILVWLPQTETGDVSEISLANARERVVWQRVCSDSATCSPSRCVQGASRPGFFYIARRKAEAAHLIIVNHALLLADIATENNVLPKYQHLIVDEAHHLEDATTNALTFRVDHASFVARLRELAPTGAEQKAVGLLSDAATVVRNSDCPKEKAEAFTALTRELADAIPLLDVRMFECIDAIDRYLAQRQGRQYDNSMYDLRLRITESERVQPAWVNIEITWDNTGLVLKRFLTDLARLLGGLEDLSNYIVEDFEDLNADILSVQRALQETHEVCEAALLEPDNNTIYWIRRSQRNGMITILSAPLHVGSLIEKYIFLTKDTVVLTSATLRTANSFDYLRDRLGAVDAEEMTLDSPFDYRKNALVYLPTDMPEPNQPAYQGKVEQAILQLSTASQGRLLALFTSYAQLQRTAEVVRPHLEETGFTLFVQGQGGSRQQLLAAFRQTEHAVLFGTRSFWEGVDVQGEALSALIIARLPFSVPTDPIVSARSETFDSPFFQFSVPEAILHLRQGFGRLIRSTSDRGICAILDKRVTSKSYGRLFLESLPDATIQRGLLDNMPVAAKRWLEEEPPVAGKEAEIKEDAFGGHDGYTPAPPPPEWWE